MQWEVQSTVFKDLTPRKHGRLEGLRAASGRRLGPSPLQGPVRGDLGVSHPLRAGGSQSTLGTTQAPDSVLTLHGIPHVSLGMGVPGGVSLLTFETPRG